MTSVTPQAPGVVYVHGAGNKLPAADLKRAWDHDLFERDMGGQTRMAYYADLLYAEPAAIAADACAPQEALAALVASTSQRAGDAGPGDAGPGQGRSLAGRALAEEAELYARLSPRGQQLALRLSMAIAVQACARLPATAAAPPAAGPWGQEAALSGPLRQLLLRELLRRLVPDADAYLFGPQGAQIRQRLSQELDAVAGTAIVVAHSLGTVVAYDVLAAASPAERQVVLVTLGSPLGYPVIQELITQPVRVPASVRLWLNFADPWDIVTLDTTLGDEFRGGPGVIDVQVDNQSPNDHAPCGYLRLSQVRVAVAAALAEAHQ